MPATKAHSDAREPFPKKTPASATGKSPAELIEARILELQDWRGDLLSRLRTLISGADPGMTEEWKWNTSLEGNVRRAIDFQEGGRIDEAALVAVVRSAITLNKESGSGKPRSAT